MRERDAALKRFLKARLNTDHLIFKSLRNRVTRELRKARATFFLDLIRDAKGNSKKLWNTIDKNSHMRTLSLRYMTVLNDSLAVAVHFNEYFLDSVQQLSQMLPAIGPPQPCPCEGPVFELSLIDEAKVHMILSNLSNSKAKDIIAWTLPS